MTRAPRMCCSCFSRLALPHGDPGLCRECIVSIAPGRCSDCGEVRNAGHRCPDERAAVSA